MDACDASDHSTQDPGWDTEDVGQVGNLSYTPYVAGYAMAPRPWESCFFTTPSMTTIRTTLFNHHWAATVALPKQQRSGNAEALGPWIH